MGASASVGMVSVTVPSLEQLEHLEKTAWNAYAQAVHDPRETAQGVTILFEKAAHATNMVLGAQRR